MLEHRVPQFRQSIAFKSTQRQNRRPPDGLAGINQPDRGGQFARRCFGLDRVPSVRFVDDDDIGEFQHAFLDALKLIAGSGQGQEDEGIDHVGNGDLGLPHPDGLHQNDVEAGGLEEHDGFSGGLGHPTESARGRRGPDVGVRVHR